MPNLCYLAQSTNHLKTRKQSCDYAFKGGKGNSDGVAPLFCNENAAPVSPFGLLGDIGIKKNKKKKKKSLMTTTMMMKKAM